MCKQCTVHVQLRDIVQHYTEVQESRKHISIFFFIFKNVLNISCTHAQPQENTGENNTLKAHPQKHLRASVTFTHSLKR